MHRKPAPRDSGGVFRRAGASIVVEGCLIGALALLAYTIGRVFFDGPAQAPQVGRTMAFAVLSLSQVAHAFNMRSEHSLFSIGFFSNPKLNLAAAVCILLQVSCDCHPGGGRFVPGGSPDRGPMGHYGIFEPFAGALGGAGKKAFPTSKNWKIQGFIKKSKKIT